MTEYKMCANEDMAIYILDFIKRGYENKYQDAGVQKYIDALQMGIDAILESKESIGKCEMAIAMRSDHNLEDDCNYCIDKAKSEAYKEIAKKLKEHLCNYDLPDYHSFRAVDEDTIDEVLKELVGEQYNGI